MKDAPLKQCAGHGNQAPHLLPAIPMNFTSNASRADGFSAYCKICAAAKQREWKHNHPKEVKAMKKAYLEKLVATRESSGLRYGR